MLKGYGLAWSLGGGYTYEEKDDACLHVSLYDDDMTYAPSAAIASHFSSTPLPILMLVGGRCWWMSLSWVG